MKAKEYLKQVELFDVKIRQKKIELAGLKEDATCTGAFDYSAEKVQTSAKADSMSNKVAKYVDLISHLELSFLDTSLCIVEWDHVIVSELWGW